MKRFFKILLIVLVSLFVLMQFYPKPKKNNNPVITQHDFSVTNTPPAPVQNILKRSCNDCHSNNTTYPWYAHVQPVAWWLGDHIREGKKELNFSEFGTYSLRRKYKKLEEIYSEVNEDKMPLSSYTRIHTDAVLSAEEKTILLDWVNAESKKMEAMYPIDSLKRKK
jgi:hypothetical protein